MNKNKLAGQCLAGSVLVLIVCLVVRVVNTTGIFSWELFGLWKLSASLVLISIALSVSKD